MPTLTLIDCLYSCIFLFVFLYFCIFAIAWYILVQHNALLAEWWRIVIDDDNVDDSWTGWPSGILLANGQPSILLTQLGKEMQQNQKWKCQKLKCNLLYQHIFYIFPLVLCVWGLSGVLKGWNCWNHKVAILLCALFLKLFHDYPMGIVQCFVFLSVGDQLYILSF